MQPPPVDVAPKSTTNNFHHLCLSNHPYSSSTSSDPSKTITTGKLILVNIYIRDVPGRQTLADASTEPFTSFIMSALRQSDAGPGGNSDGHTSDNNCIPDILDLEAGLWQEAPFPRLPDDAPPELQDHLQDVENPRRVWAIYRASRRHDFQLLVERYAFPYTPNSFATV